MRDIWIISEIPETASELVSKAKTLLSEMGRVTVFVNGNEEVGSMMFSSGADHVYLLQLPPDTVWEQYVSVIAEKAAAVKPELILVGATRRGKDLAAQLAAFLDSPCISESKSIELEGKNLVLERYVYGGLGINKILCTDFPVVVTVAAKTFAKGEADSSRKGIWEKLELRSEKNIKVINRMIKTAETVNIGEAGIVIGVGRGFAEEKQLVLAQELAQAVGGEIGCTRPIAEDLHWLPEDRYIGISGKVIKPEFYLAAGVSGQVQHVYGIKDAKVIAAVDKNENAPIFQVADYYIVGDLTEVLPAITLAAKELKV